MATKLMPDCGRSSVAFAVAVFLVAFVSPAPLATQTMSKQEKKDAEQRLANLLLNKNVVAKVIFPATQAGIDLRLDGSWNHESIGYYLQQQGIGVEIGETVRVTDTRLESRQLEVHLNGGGKDPLVDTAMGKAPTDPGVKQSGGSRINLRFYRDIRPEDITAATLAEWLSPLIDTAPLRRIAMLEMMPREFKEAASFGQVVAGMTKPMVAAILGDPVARQLDLGPTPPAEKWQYELPGSFQILVVTFKAGRVTAIRRY